jgi:D-3-phosphoglycerate dehydrogenase
MAHLYGGVRFLYDANRQMPLDGDSKFKDLKKAYEAGTELQGKTLGVIGFGRIGQALAKLALGVGMKVIQHDTYPTPTEVSISFFDGQTLKMSVPKVSLEELLKSSDFVSLHVPGGDIIGEKELAIMKDGAGIVNAARGGVVNEVALMDALNSGKLKFAALDVFVDEPTPAVQVLMNPHVSLSPHIGAATLEAQDRIGTELADLINQHA